MPIPDPHVLDPDAPDIHTEAAQLRERGPATRVQLPGGVTAWSVSDPATLRRVLTDPRVSKDPEKHWPAWQDGEVPPDWEMMVWVNRQDMFTAYGPEHRRLRLLVSGAFTPRRIAALRPWIERLVEDLLDALGEADEFPADLRERFAQPLPIGVISQLVGFSDDASRAELRRISDIFVSTTAEPGQSVTAFRQGWRLFVELVAAKRRTPGDDLTSALLGARDEDDSRLTEEEMIHTIFLLIGAGHETTVNLLDHAITALLTHPGQLELVRSGRCSWGDVIEETLRWQAPIANLPLRYAVEDIDLGEVTIPAGEPILAAYGGANRCPHLHVDADRFDITRENKEHLSFGHGVHFCVGASLARLEAEIALPALFARYPGIRLAVPPDELRPIASFISNGHRELPVHLGPRAG